MAVMTASSGPRGHPTIWLIIAAGSVVTALTLGVRSTFGLFLDPVVETIGSGRGSFALAIAIQNIVWGISQPFAGAIADRFGSARVLAVGAVIYCLGLVLMSTAQSSDVLYLSAGFVVGVGTGAASFAVVLASVGRMVPPEKRMMALGIVSAMGSVGQFLLVPIVQRLIDSAGWQEAAIVLAAVILLIIAFAPVLRRQSAAISTGQTDSSQQPPLSHELRRAAYSRSYRLLNLGFFVCGFHVTFIATHLASYSESVGQTRSIAALALALIGLFNIAGSLAAGVLGSRYPKAKLLSGIYAGRALVIAAFVLVPPGSAATIVFGAMMGVLWLSTVPLTSGVVTSQFGTAHAGTLFGIVFLSHQLGAFIGAWLGGSLADQAGSYDPAWWIAVGLGVMAAVVHLFIDERPQPDPPVSARLSPSAVGSAAAFGAAIVVTGTMALAVDADQMATAGDEGSPGWSPYCVIHPPNVS